MNYGSFDEERVMAHWRRVNSQAVVVRPHTQYGSVRLSIQAGPIFDSHPKIGSLKLDDYARVEVAILDDYNGRWLLPSQVGVLECDEFWNERSEADAPVIGSFVPWDVVEVIRAALVLFIEPREDEDE